MNERMRKIEYVQPGKLKVSVGTEDILAIAAFLVSAIIALGIVFQAVDAAVGGGIIVPLVAAAGIAQVVKARRRDGGDAQA